LCEVSLLVIVSIAVYFGSAFAYNGYMLMIVLKLIYVFFLAVFFYLNLWFTGIVSFLRVNFFGI